MAIVTVVEWRGGHLNMGNALLITCMSCLNIELALSLQGHCVKSQGYFL